jgi:hypothetical protein
LDRVSAGTIEAVKTRKKASGDTKEGSMKVPSLPEFKYHLQQCWLTPFSNADLISFRKEFRDFCNYYDKIPYCKTRNAAQEMEYRLKWFKQTFMNKLTKGLYDF